MMRCTLAVPFFCEMEFISWADDTVICSAMTELIITPK